MCEVKISMFQLCRQVGMLIAIAYVSNYRSMSDLKCKQIHLNPNWHEGGNFPPHSGYFYYIDGYKK